MSKSIKLYTDGSCSGNPGPGGWGWVLQYGEHQKGGYGACMHTTNNRMELLAVITGLHQITNKSIPVEVYSDSNYIVNAMTQGWIENWRSRDWLNTRKKEVANRDLWEYLSQLTTQFDTISFNWVKGHNGHPGNEQADQLAREGMELGAYAVELSV